MPLISAGINYADHLNLLRLLVYPEIYKKVFDQKLADTLAAPRLFVCQRNAIGELIQRKDFFRQDVQHFHSCSRSLKGITDLVSDFTELFFCRMHDFYCIFLRHLLQLPFQVCKDIRSKTGVVSFRFF